MDHELTDSIDQGATSDKMKMLERRRPGIVAVGASLSAGRVLVAVPPTVVGVPFLPEADSVSES